MVKLIAHTKAYFGSRVLEAGDGFECPDDIWNDEKRRPLWAGLPGDIKEPVADTAVKPPATPAVELIPIPADWEDMSAADRRALASKISGSEVKRAPDADKIIEAYVEANKPAPFSDAPAPQTVAEAQKAVGGVQPDWEAPGGATQVAD